MHFEPHIESTFVDIIITRVRLCLQGRNILDAIGYMGVALDCFPKNEELCRGAAKFVVGTYPSSSENWLEKVERDAVSRIESIILPFLMESFPDPETAARMQIGGVFERNGAATVPFLSEILNSSEPGVRKNASMALGATHSVLAVPALISALKDDEPLVRAAAANALFEIGRIAKDSTPALLKALADSNPIVRGNAVAALAEIEQTSTPSLLASLLENGSTSVRASAARALGQIGSAAAPVIKSTIEKLKHPREMAREQAMRNLGKIGVVAVPLLADALSNSEGEFREYVVRALGETEAENALPLLLPLLEERSGSIGWIASASLAALGPPAVPALSEQLRSTKSHVRERAANALGWMGSAAVESVPALAQALNDEASSVREAVAAALGAIGIAGLTPLLSTLMRVEDSDRWSVAAAIEEIGLAAVPTLISMLADAELSTREQAAIILGGIGSDAGEAVPALIHMLKSDEESGQIQAAVALGEIGSPAADLALDALISALNGTVPLIAANAAAALGKLGCPPPKRIVAELVDAQSHRDQRVKDSAYRAVLNLGARHPAAAVSHLLELWDAGTTQAFGQILNIGVAAIKPLLTIFRDSNAPLRHWSRTALLAFGAQAVPSLIEALRDESVDVREQTALMLGEIAPDAAVTKAVSHIINLLYDNDKAVRAAAAWALGKVGPPAIRAVPRLRALLHDVAMVRFHAAQAIKEIGPNNTPPEWDTEIRKIA